MNASDIMEPSEPGPATEAMVGFDQACTRCGYNLRGLSTAGVCPECGAPVADSLRGFLLRYASPEYRRMLMRSLGLITNGILLLIALAFTGPVLGAIGIPWVGNVYMLTQLLVLVPNAMILAGYWWYTTPDPGLSAGKDSSKSRRVVRAATGFQIAALAIFTVADLAQGVVTGPAGTIIGILYGVALTVSLLTWVVHFIATMLYTRWIASRLPSRKWMGRAKLYCWLLPVLVLGPLLVQMAGLLFLVGRTTPAPAGGATLTPVTAAPAIAAGVGMMWAGCLMIVGALIALVLYWNMLYYLRQMIRQLDEAASR